MHLREIDKKIILNVKFKIIIINILRKRNKEGTQIYISFKTSTSQHAHRLPELKQPQNKQTFAFSQ